MVQTRTIYRSQRENAEPYENRVCHWCRSRTTEALPAVPVRHRQKIVSRRTLANLGDGPRADILQGTSIEGAARLSHRQQRGLILPRTPSAAAGVEKPLPPRNRFSTGVYRFRRGTGRTREKRSDRAQYFERQICRLIITRFRAGTA